MSAELKAADFSAFFKALHGFNPFPWQARLAEHLCAIGEWPALLDLPTGSGKTACIDIAVFHLAFSSGAANRKAPLRIAWVVDRRLIVDEAYDRAQKIAERLENAEHGILKAVADRLSVFSGAEEVPLIARRLRGGIPQEGDWARTPGQPTVLSSTVDQVGSRLLFRGYGISRSMHPVHAGLLGEDTLVVLDEVHLSEPFRQTLEAVAGYPRKMGLPWRFVQLTATPRAETGAGSDANVAFALGADDRANEVLRTRLAARKPATLLHKRGIEYGSEAHANLIAETALAMAPAGASKNVLIVVNRVGLAREIHRQLHDRSGDLGGASMLLIGKGRDVDKDLRSAEVLVRCKSGQPDAERYAGGNPYFVVATQCVEAGADLDFDALVAQIAPLDALRQRFGRLNRMGRAIAAQAAIVAVDAEVAASAAPDPIYGTKPRETWKWLEERAKAGLDNAVDFGIDAMRPTPAEAAALSSPSLDAPVLMPTHVSALSRTNPPPPWSPDPSLYLHGSPNSPADVNVIWRADLEEPAIQNSQEVTALFALVPPRAREAISLSIGVVTRWLRNEQPSDIADVDAGLEADADVAESRGAVRAAWAVRGGDEGAALVRPGGRGRERLRPGDTIVVPSSYGGCDRFGWDPTHQGNVDDVASVAAEPFEAERFAFRLHERLLAQAIAAQGRARVGEGATEANADAASRWKLIAEVLGGYDRSADIIDALLHRLPEGVLPSAWREALEKLEQVKSQVVLRFPYGEEAEGESPGANGAVLLAKYGLARAAAPKASGSQYSESATEADILGACGCAGAGESLAAHSESVRREATVFAGILRLPKKLASDIELAAYLHDAGKADPRFQQYLAGGPWLADEILAKSGKRRSAVEDRKIRQECGLPVRWRHEALSVRIAREHPEFATANDPELVLWLIGTHHGYGRPLFPHAEPRDDQVQSLPGIPGCSADPLRLAPSAGPQRIDFILPLGDSGGLLHVDWSTMFTRLEDRYGAWGLAFLESTVRLADHRASERNARTTGALA